MPQVKPHVKLQLKNGWPSFLKILSVRPFLVNYVQLRLPASRGLCIPMYIVYLISLFTRSLYLTFPHGRARVFEGGRVWSGRQDDGRVGLVYQWRVGLNRGLPAVSGTTPGRGSAPPGGGTGSRVGRGGREIWGGEVGGTSSWVGGGGVDGGAGAGEVRGGRGRRECFVSHPAQSRVTGAIPHAKYPYIF